MLNEQTEDNHEPVTNSRNSHNMDYIRLLINLALSGIFYYFFGQVNIDKFSHAGVSVTKYQEVLAEFPPPGKLYNSIQFSFQIVKF